MLKTSKTWDPLTQERRTTLLREITTYFQTKQDQDIGIIAAEEILDFFLEHLKSDFYIQAIAEAKTILRQNIENTEIDLDVLINT